jgi:tetratricopeptide (TPR) repeat protein
MHQELNLEFPTENQVIIHFHDQHSDRLDFQSPVTEEDQKDISWYLEVYAYLYTTDVDDKRADKIAARLPILGESLLKSVCYNDKAAELFQQFHRKKNVGRLLTISASQPAILSLPWELLRFNDNYLFHDAPRISIRRRLANLDTAKKPLAFTAKRRLHLLFVVSRPHGASFIDPRTDPIAVLDALDQTGRIIEVEFLRPATLGNLIARLKDKTKPPIDILHFDGHGAFDSKESKGYLLFPKAINWDVQEVSAEGLGLILGSANIPLVILSACQSAAIGDSEEPMGTVAVQLTHAGVPSVIAMTHSVHVNATRALFSAFYQHLTQSKGIGEALDNARSDLYQNPDRIELQRGQEHVTLKLYDWFLPALYQAGEDTPLLTKPIDVEKPAEVHWGNLRALQAAGFWGRTPELWFIECAFVQDETRRFTISGFGGEGKTYLAIEIGYWLYRTGLFEKVCFVDYDAFQGVDAVGWAVSTLATVLDKSLVDAQAATAALAQQPTLLILDNLEAITTESLSELLTVAKEWSEIGQCRVLLTTRTPDFHHPDYPIEGGLVHQSLALGGLAEYDDLKYFERLMKLPPPPQVQQPKRDELLRLFQKVDFHPLSISLLASRLKEVTPDKLGERLEALLEETPDNPLLASLNLSLDRLDEESRRLLPKLGVFQGGALLSNLIAITELSESQWQNLLSALISVSLIQSEDLGGNVMYLKFHPTLAPALWIRLATEEQAQLRASHRQRYYELSGYLYDEDYKNPYETRAIVQRELPNLLFAVHGTLDVDETYAVDFVDSVNRFLKVFGLKRDSKALSQRIEHLDDFTARSNKGQQLFNAAQYQAAAQVFGEMLKGLGEQVSNNRCFTLNQLGRCFKFQRKLAQAIEYYRQGLAVAEQLEPSQYVKRLMSALQTDLADALMDKGDDDGAKKYYQKSLAIDKEIGGDARGEAVVLGQLGTLAMLQGNRQEATKYYTEVRNIFYRLNEPEGEAVFYNQQGMVYQEDGQWEAAEQAYRKAAQLFESQGNLAGATGVWNNLALVNKGAGKPEEAEAWYRKVIEGGKAVENNDVSFMISNLADLLQTYFPNRLPEARQLAEEALAIKKKLDSAVAESWKTYHILAQIVEQQNDTAKASEYRRQSREAYQEFQGARYELQEFEPLIAGVAAAVAVDYAKVRQAVELELKKLVEKGWGNLVATIRRILDGERDEAVLCEPLDYTEGAIINAILRGIAGEV